MRLVIWILLLCLFVLAGCGADEYAIEKRYWQAQKQAEKIFSNPQASPPRELSAVVRTLNNFIKNYPQNQLSIEAEFNIARLYIIKEEYDKARIQLREIINKYAKSDGIRSEAIFLIGNSYEREDKWNLAIQQYRKVMQDFSTTMRGLDIPIYIAQHYKIKYQPEKMIAAYQEAIGYYKDSAAKYPNSPFAFNAESLVAQCYLALKDWQNAISTSNTIIENYKNKMSMDGVLMSIALIYNNELKDKIKTKETLGRLIKEYPKSNLIKTATALLKELEKK
jgi:TolA-binding protein